MTIYILVTSFVWYYPALFFLFYTCIEINFHRSDVLPIVPEKKRKLMRNWNEQHKKAMLQ